MSVQPKFIPVYFAPDQDPSWQTNPGVLPYVGNMVPTIRGTLANWVSTNSEKIGAFGTTAAVSSDYPVSAAILKRVGASTARRYFCGTNKRLLEYQTAGAALTDVSRAAAGPYTATEWTFDAFGDIMFATCCDVSTLAQPTEFPQFSQGAAGTAFANLTTGTPPKAKLCVVQQNFLLLFDVYDGTNWYADGWCCSGLGNTASWATTTANLTTQANNGRLLATPGPIRAVAKQRDTVVVYKDDSMYVMSYSGNPYTWSTRLISDKIGQECSSGVAVVNGVHYFLHRSGVYKFDGSYPQNVGSGLVNSFLSAQMRSLGFASVRAAVDYDHQLIVWYLQTAQDGANTGLYGSALVYNYLTGKFGWVDKIVEEQGDAIGFGCPLVGTRSEFSPLMETPFYGLANFTRLVSGGVYDLRGVNIGKGSQTGETAATIYTGDIGDDAVYTKLTRIKPRLVVGDGDLQAATCYVDGKASLGDYYTGQGISQSFTASAAGAGGSTNTVRTYGAQDYPTVAADDYLAFTMYATAGDVGTVVLVNLTFSDASSLAIQGTITALNTARTISGALAAASGKFIQRVSCGITSTGAAGAHQISIRDIRITNSALTLRRRIAFSFEDSGLYSRKDLPVGTMGTAAVEDAPSWGSTYTFDATKRRFDGTVSNRWLKARMTFYNKTELAGLYLTVQQAGTE